MHEEGVAPAEWRPVPGYESRYEVSSEGQVRSVARGLLKPRLNDSGYPSVYLYDGTRRRPRRRAVHNLVAEAFIGPRQPGLEVRHLDGNHENARLGNLAYGTSTENHLDAVQHGTHPFANRTRCPQDHEYDAVTPKGARYCKTCKRDKSRARRALRDTTH